MSTEPNWEKAFLGMNIYFDCFLELFKKIEKRKDVPEEVKKMMDKELEKANNKWDKFMGFRKTGMVGDWERWEFKSSGDRPL